MKQRELMSLLLISILVSLTVGSLLQDDCLLPKVSAVTGFNVVVSPPSQSVDYTVNQFAWYSVLVQSVEGFNGLVKLNATVSGPSTKISLNFPAGSTVNVPKDGQAFTYVMATVGSPADVPVGMYTIKITGWATSESSIPGWSSYANVGLAVIVNEPAIGDFRLSSTPGTVIDVVPGGTGSLQINVMSFRTTPGIYQVSLLTAASSPSEITAIFDPFILNVQGYLTNTSSLQVTTTELTPAGNYTVVITGSASLATYGEPQRVHTWAITVRVSGFYISAPMFKSVIRGKSTAVGIGVQSVGTFSSTVTMTASNVPAGMTAIFNPASVLPPPGGLGSSNLEISTLSSLSEGTYYLTLRGTSGLLQSSQSIGIRVGDFSIDTTPASRTAEQNSTATYTVTATSSDDYSALVSLAVTGLPSGVTATFSSSSVLIPPASSNSSTLSLAISSTSPVGTYNLLINGTSGTQSHTTNVTLIIIAAPDFTLSISPTSATVRNGSSKAFTITVFSVNSFNSPVTLTVTLPPASGASGSISPASVTPPPNGLTTATLTVTTAATAPAGTGTMTVTGTSGAKTRITTATLTISPTAGICIIATATYGSEMAPEVYFLRLFRDRSVQTTFAGNQFMNVFNAWYYSFSPTVAEQVKGNLLLRNVVKAALYPLIGSLYLAQWVYSTLSFAPELAVVAAGLVASSLIGVVYFAPIALLAAELARRKRISIRPIGKPLAVAWVASIATIGVAELTAVSPLMMFATAAFVLSTVALATKATVTQTQRLLH